MTTACKHPMLETFQHTTLAGENIPNAS